MSLFYIASSIWVVISFILLFFAWRLAVAGKTTLHRNLMIFLTSGAWMFIASYLFQQPYGTELTSLPREYIIWIAFHGTVGLIPLIGATCLVVSRIMAKGKGRESYLNRHHKLYGRVIIVLWFFTHLGGIFNIFLLN
jgi:uncharacterized membrane protein YozB (DUF420 family)